MTALTLLKTHWLKLLAVFLIAGAYTVGRVHQSWKEGAAQERETAAQLEADQDALKAWGNVSGAFTDWLVRFLSPNTRPDIVRIVHDTPNRDDCPHSAVSARLRNENARALNAARARERRSIGSDAALSRLAHGRARRQQP